MLNQTLMIINGFLPVGRKEDSGAPVAADCVSGNRPFMKPSALIASLALMLQLGACAWLLPEKPPPAKVEAPPTPAADLQPPPPVPPRKPAVPSTLALNPAGPMPSVTTEPEMPSPAADPEGLIGLDQKQIESLLGTPQQSSESAPARIWHYAGRNCQLEIYFYLDLKSQVMRALHYEVKSNDTADPARDRCFSDLVARHEAGVSPASANPAR
ncbi:MAG TPA: hypothetical protein VMG55_19125 [Stellaceae bacterium]|nr:hypothetical protein [Stellaceae bacterium]